MCNAQRMSEAPNVGVPEWDLADRMRKGLRQTGLGVSEIADEMGVKRGTVSTWINGKIVPPRPMLMLWAMRTGVPLEWLLTGKVADKGGGPGAPKSTD